MADSTPDKNERELYLQKRRRSRLEYIAKAQNIWKKSVLENEVWVDIPGYDGEFQISNYGRVTRKIFLKPYHHISGYIHLFVRGKCKKQHRLIAEAFIPKVDGKNFVNHKNGIKSDNRIENLEWVTISENIKHAYRLELIPPKKGMGHPGRKLDEHQVRTIFHSSMSLNDLAAKYKVNTSCIAAIKKRKIWKHLEM